MGRLLKANPRNHIFETLGQFLLDDLAVEQSNVAVDDLIDIAALQTFVAMRHFISLSDYIDETLSCSTEGKLVPAHICSKYYEET